MNSFPLFTGICFLFLIALTAPLAQAQRQDQKQIKDITSFKGFLKQEKIQSDWHDLKDEFLFKKAFDNGLDKGFSVFLYDSTIRIYTFKSLDDRKRFNKWYPKADQEYPVWQIIYDQQIFVIQYYEPEITEGLIKLTKKLFRRNTSAELYDAVLQKDQIALIAALQRHKQWKSMRFHFFYNLEAIEDFFDMSFIHDASLSHLIANYGTPEMMQMLIDQNVDLKATCKLKFPEMEPTEWHSGTANDLSHLQLAVFNSFKMVELLIKHGADVNHHDSGGWTPLLEAWSGYFDEESAYGDDVQKARESKRIVELLLKHNADPSVINMYGENLLSVSYDDMTIKHAVKLGVKPVTTKYGNTILHNHVSELTIEMAKKYKIDINQQAQDGNTALHSVWNVEAAVLLIKAGADPHLKNEDGQTALDIAIENEDDEMINYLRDVMKER